MYMFKNIKKEVRGIMHPPMRFYPFTDELIRFVMMCLTRFGGLKHIIDIGGKFKSRIYPIRLWH